jgi:hypothetical protein
MQLRDRQAAAKERNQLLADPDLNPLVKHAIQTQHTMDWGRALFMCPGCWLLPHYCICQLLQRSVSQTKVIVHVHHKEW